MKPNNFSTTTTRAGLNFQEWYKYSQAYGKQRWTKTDSVPKYCKVFPDQFENFFGHQRFEIVEEHLPFVKWVYLRRNDLAAQTASFLLAKRSKVWNHGCQDLRQAARLEHTSIEFADDEVILCVIKRRERLRERRLKCYNSSSPPESFLPKD